MTFSRKYSSDDEAMAILFPEINLQLPQGNELYAAQKALDIVQGEQIRCGSSGGPGTGTYNRKDLAKAIQKAILDELE